MVWDWLTRARRFHRFIYWRNDRAGLIQLCFQHFNKLRKGSETLIHDKDQWLILISFKDLASFDNVLKALIPGKDQGSIRITSKDLASFDKAFKDYGLIRLSFKDLTDFDNVLKALIPDKDQGLIRVSFKDLASLQTLTHQVITKQLYFRIMVTADLYPHIPHHPPKKTTLKSVVFLCAM